jgi:hypothetical protein
MILLGKNAILIDLAGFPMNSILFLNPPVYMSLVDFFKVFFRPNDSGLKEGLVALEYHSILDLAILIEVEPGAVRALTGLMSIIEDPFTLFISDGSLHFRKKLILDANVTIGRPSNHYLLVIVRATTKVT